MLCSKSGMAQPKQKKAWLWRRVLLSLFAFFSTSECRLLELQPAVAEATEAARCQQKSRGQWGPKGEGSPQRTDGGESGPERGLHLILENPSAVSYLYAYDEPESL